MAVAYTHTVQKVDTTVTVSIDAKFPLGPQKDYLFVIDNSGSMTHHQQSLASHAQVITDRFNNTAFDFHIGVITSESDKSLSGQLIGNESILTPSTNNLSANLYKNLMAGPNGSGNEVFFDNVLTAINLSGKGQINEGFIRPKADLQVIFLTDTDDVMSVTPLEFAYQLTKLKPKGEISLSGFVISDPTACEGDFELDEKLGAKNIKEALRILNGDVYDLCDTNKSITINEFLDKAIPKQLVDYKPQESLENIPLIGKVDEGTISVIFGTQIILNHPDTGWTFDPTNSTISFGTQIDWKMHRPGTTINVHYKVLD